MRTSSAVATLLFGFLAGALASLPGCSGSSSSSVGAVPAGTAGRPAAIKNANPGKGSLLIVGDSLAYGTGSTDHSVAPEGCLQGRFGGAAKNISAPGLTTSEVMSNMAGRALPMPRLIFISVGGNDALRDGRTPGSYPASKSLSEAEGLFDNLLKTGALVVYLALTPGLGGTERLGEIASLAQSKGVLVVDAMNGFWGNKNLMSDFIHPNNAGYKLMCERLVKAIEPHYP